MPQYEVQTEQSWPKLVALSFSGFCISRLETGEKGGLVASRVGNEILPKELSLTKL